MLAVAGGDGNQIRLPAPYAPTFTATTLPSEPQKIETYLLRITATGLGKSAIRDTVKETLKLAQDPAAQALREQISLWTTSLEGGNLDALEDIRKEISKAANELHKPSALSRANNVGTWFSMGATLATSVINPLLGMGVGVLTGAIGIATQAEDVLDKKKPHWSSFGHYV